MLSDEIDEEKRGTKVPRTRRRKSQPALWGASWSSERSSYRVIESECRSRWSGRRKDNMERKSACKTREYRTPWAIIRQQRCRIQNTKDRCRQSRCRDQIPTKWTEKERRLPNVGNCQEAKAKWHPELVARSQCLLANRSA